MLSIQLLSRTIDNMHTPMMLIRSRSILFEHRIPIPGKALKPDLVELFETEVRPKGNVRLPLLPVSLYLTADKAAAARQSGQS